MMIYKKIDSVKSKIGKLSKDTSNPFFKSKYADINQLIDLTDQLFRDNDLMCIQPIIDGCLVTQIIDLTDGTMITSSIKLPDSNDPQKIGSAITYYRRYSLKSLLNIQEEDDDGNKASGNIQEEDDKRPWLNETQFNNYLALINKGEKWLDKIKKKYRIKKAYSTTLESAEKNYKPQQ
ncbi:ERF family protein [Sphingobacterium spiritivorum]|uniref:ERF family protein n=2 Tax=Sphingobacterium spiritivorum TaxID=258 RepID=UPI003DA48FAD